MVKQVQTGSRGPDYVNGKVLAARQPPHLQVILCRADVLIQDGQLGLVRHVLLREVGHRRKSLELNPDVLGLKVRLLLSGYAQLVNLVWGEGREDSGLGSKQSA